MGWARIRSRTMIFLNFHTHHPVSANERAIVQGRDSWGIHPWHATETALQEFPPSYIKAIGECGLDRVCNTPYELQLRVFMKHVEFSEQLQLPLIIHCVKAIDDILLLHRKTKPSQPWIIHGFRGKPQQLQSLISQGLYVSFGFRYHPQSILECPLDRFFLETDNDPAPIALLYEKVALARLTTPEELNRKIHENFKRIHLCL